MEKPINLSADLKLDDDFIRRAMALKGGREINAADLRFLLEMGLVAMEAFVSEGQDGCDDPDCVACRSGRGEQPRSTMMAEFNALRAGLEQYAAESAGRSLAYLVVVTLDRLLQVFAGGLHPLLHMPKKRRASDGSSFR